MNFTVFYLFLKMQFFNFHHHNSNESFGIYNAGKFLPKNIPFSVGINPVEIPENWEEDFGQISDLVKNENCIAIGECGLDSRFPNEKLQREIFLKHLQLAENLQKPIIIHCVRKFEEVVFLAKKFTIPKIIHGYNKDEKTTKMLLENGFHLSFGASILHNLSLQQIFTEVPLSKIFLETDDNPTEIKEIYKKACALKQISLEEMTENIRENLKK